VASTSLAGSPSARASAADKAQASAKMAVNATMRAGTNLKSMVGCRARLAVALCTAVGVTGVAPAPAEAHGPVDPTATSYLARVSRVPAGLDAKVIDGDQRMWLEVGPDEDVVVLDYRGAPYLRFSPAGVDVNQNSAMYYLNQTPVALPTPPNLSAQTPASWQRVSSGHAYGWHDGRLHALATVALTPGARYVGSWTIPLLIGARRTAIVGGLWYAPDPSIVWFWPIVVLFLCVLAAWRVRSPTVDELTARLLAVSALAAIALAGLARNLHGRPTVSVFQLLELAAVLVFVGWALFRLLFRSPGYGTYFVIAIAGLWEGAQLIPTLLNGFVLAAVPATAARAASVIALGASGSLLLMIFRLAERPDAASPSSSGDDESVWELA
jgi:hypothetical protein